MADEFDNASEHETREREASIQQHAQYMAKLVPSDNCKEPDCEVELPAHRKPWGTCIDCATRKEQASKAFARQ